MFKSSKKDLTQPLTLGDFQEFTKGLDKVIAATVREEIRPVEKRLDERITGVEKRISSVELRLVSRIDAVETRLEKKITEFKSDILNKVDAVFHEVKAMREEQTAKVGRDDDQDKDIVVLKTRVSAVEHHLGLAQAVNS